MIKGIECECIQFRHAMGGRRGGGERWRGGEGRRSREGVIIIQNLNIISGRGVLTNQARVNETLSDEFQHHALGID